MSAFMEHSQQLSQDRIARNGMEALWFILAQEGDFYYWKELLRASLLGILVRMVFPYTAVSSLLRDGTDSKQGSLQRMVS